MLQVSNTVFRVWVKKYIQETREIKVDEWQPEAMTFIASASRLHTLHMPPLSRLSKKKKKQKKVEYVSALDALIRKNTSLTRLTPDHLHLEFGLFSLVECCPHLRRLALCHEGEDKVEQSIKMGKILTHAAQTIPLLPALMLRFPQSDSRAIKIQTLFITLLTQNHAFRQLEVLHMEDTFGCPFSRAHAAFFPSLHTLILRHHSGQVNNNCCFELAYFLPGLPALRVLRLCEADEKGFYDGMGSSGTCGNWDQDPNIARITLPALEELHMDRACTKLWVPQLRKLVLHMPLLDDFRCFTHTTKLEEAQIGPISCVGSHALVAFAMNTPRMRKIELTNPREPWLDGLPPHWPLLQSLSLRDVEEWGATSSRQFMQSFPALRAFEMTVKSVRDDVLVGVSASQPLLRLTDLTSLTIGYACQTSLDDLDLPRLEQLLLCFVEQWPVPLTLSPFLNACTTLVVLHLEMDDAYPFVPDMFGTMRFPSLRIFRINAGPLTPQLLTCFLPGMPILESLCVMGASKDIGQCATPICTHASITTLRYISKASPRLSRFN